MSKVKVQEATKELSQGAGKLLEEVTRVRKSAQDLLQSLKKAESSFLQKEEELKEQELKEQQRQIMSAQSKAWTMPDAEEPAAPEAEPQAAAPVQKKPEEKPAPAPQPAVEKRPQPAVTPAAPVRPAAPATASGAPVAPRPVRPAAPVAPGAQRPMQRPAMQGAQQGRPMQPRPYQGQGAQGNRPYGQSPQGGPARPMNGPRPMGPRPFGQGGPRPASAAGGPRPAGSFGQGGPRPMGPRPGMGRKGPELVPTVEKERVSNYDPNKKLYMRQHDPERVARNRKQLVRENGIGFDDEVVRGGRKKRKPQSVQQTMAPIKIEKAYMTAETITVKDLTERIGKPAGEIIKKLLLLGIMATINQELDYDTAQLVCSEFGIELEKKLEKTAEDVLTESDEVVDDEDDLLPRPPVVTIMGHVDHGKTSLLDYIRKSHVTEGEAGGITQHIGAYTAQCNGRTITFLDTPGHEAFTSMRARGTQATDIAVLVVAADDGVMPQTVESINHAKAAKVPIIVAINKIDKPGANIERVKEDLTRYEIVSEEWGGDTIMVPVSAHTGEGIEELLENILLLADVQELRANPKRAARGVIIEARLDKTRGPVATVLVQNGTLHTGDNVVAGMAFGRIRAMVNSRGERVKSAGPSMPVEVIGFGDVPEAGDAISAVDERLSRQVVEERRAKQKAEMVKKSARVTLDELYSQIAAGNVKDLNIIIKADVQGSVEAVKQSLEKLSNDEVRVRTIHSGVGAITENDVMLANIDNAIIIGFNVRADAKATAAAARDNIDIRFYRIIYQAIEDVENAMKGLLAPEFKENVLGHAEVRTVFKVSGVGTVAGSYVTDGKVQRNASVRLLRDNVVVFEGKLDSLKRFKDDAREVAAGYECGIGLEKFNDIKEGDVIECFVMEEVAR
ncbi:MAG TPA: translation initiation factor IF-2 [Candidatus Onthenecus intestinigallinarum]|uniref:Translation initiation factor IF-2 n=1 Tax=Candidatus Onthenecus intestinigallinarum TaxID=2840875 RepID=A0A9D1CSE3_9FIRM|nr:translation initiation factor IF-2 [Candidatus Onthenecus intestinigallinarum]